MGVFWYRFPHWAFTRLPAWIDGPVIVVFTTFFFLVLGRIRKAIASNLEPVLGRANLWTRWGRAVRTMYVFAWCLAERYRRVVAPERFEAVLDGEENWRQVVAGERGVVLVTAHIGPWESAVRFGAAEARRRTHVVRETEIDPRAQEFLTGMLAKAGDDCITHFAVDDPALGIELVKALGRGEIVALQGDRPRTGGRTVPVVVFGRPFPLPIGPAALARAAGVPLVPAFNFREGRFILRSVVRPAIHVARTSDRDADIAEALQRLGTEIEWAIRERPYQWFCFKRLWS